VRFVRVTVSWVGYEPVFWIEGCGEGTYWRRSQTTIGTSSIRGTGYPCLQRRLRASTLWKLCRCSDESLFFNEAWREGYFDS